MANGSTKPTNIIPFLSRITATVSANPYNLSEIVDGVVAAT